MTTSSAYIVVRENGVLWLNGVRKKKPKPEHLAAIDAKVRGDAHGWLFLRGGGWEFYPDDHAQKEGA